MPYYLLYSYILLTTVDFILKITTIIIMITDPVTVYTPAAVATQELSCAAGSSAAVCNKQAVKLDTDRKLVTNTYFIN